MNKRGGVCRALPFVPPPFCLVPCLPFYIYFVCFVCLLFAFNGCGVCWGLALLGAGWLVLWLPCLLSWLLVLLCLLWVCSALLYVYNSFNLFVFSALVLWVLILNKILYLKRKENK